MARTKRSRMDAGGGFRPRWGRLSDSSSTHVSARVLAVVGLCVSLAEVGQCQLSPRVVAVTRANSIHRIGAPLARAQGMGTVSAAVPGASSANPACWATCNQIELTAEYRHLHFHKGPEVDLVRTDALLPVSGVGVLKASFLSVSSETEASRLVGGLEAHVRNRGLMLGYGRAVTEALSLGVVVLPFDASDIRLKIPGRGKVVTGRGETELGLRVGALYRAPYDVHLGVMFDHLAERWKARFEGAPDLETKENCYINLWTLGASYTLPTDTLVGVDYKFGRVNGAGVHRDRSVVNVGVEQKVTDFLAVRTGLDDGRVTAGFSIGFGDESRLTLNYAFTANSNHDLRKAFGHGELHTLSIGAAF